MSVVVAIPARMESSRLPGKPLMIVRGKQLLRWAYGSAAGLSPVVLTDSQEILRFCRQYGLQVAFDNSRSHRTGSDRVAGWLGKLCDKPQAVVNLQCDQLDLGPHDLRQAAGMASNGVVGTLARPLLESELNDQASVKVRVVHGQAVEFVRWWKTPAEARRQWALGCWFHHVGVYAYTPETLRTFADLRQSEGELKWGLEQLRLLERGYTFRCAILNRHVESVNTQNDLVRIESAA